MDVEDIHCGFDEQVYVDLGCDDSQRPAGMNGSCELRRKKRDEPPDCRTSEKQRLTLSHGYPNDSNYQPMAFFDNQYCLEKGYGGWNE